MNERELREAAELWGEYQRTKTIASGDAAKTMDAGLRLADWAVAELARRDAEAIERAQPITEEYLDSLVAVDASLKMPLGRITRGHYVWRQPRWCLWLNGSLLPVETIGQLDDLLRALKGGASGV